MLRFTLGVLFLSHVQAQNTTKKDGETECDFNRFLNGKDTGKKIKCQWQTECSKSSNETLSGCLLKGNKVCERFQYLDIEGKVAANNLPMGCHPTETCCDGKCCSETQTCVELKGPGTATFQYDWQEYNVQQIARNGWKTPAGDAIKHKPKTCIDKVFSTDSGSKALFTPIIAMILVLVVAYSGFNRSTSGLWDKISPALVVVTSFFLMLSQGWAFALITAFVASITMATPKDKQGWLVLGHLLILWLYFGGGSFIFQLLNMDNFFDLAQRNSLEGQGGLISKCVTFYDYYSYATGNADKAWDTSPTRVSWGLCGREFLGFQIMMSYMNAFAVFTMITLTVHNYLGQMIMGNKDTTTPVDSMNPVNQEGGAAP